MAIEIVTIGNEILSGSIVNTNTVFLSRRLFEEGWSVSCHTTFPDEKMAIIAGVQAVLARSSTVIVTGGLGNTVDDVTKQSLDALFIHPAEEIANHVGQAPGLKYHNLDKHLFVLPGIPQEMEVMFEKEVLPFLKKHTFSKKNVIRRKWNFFTLSENEVDPLFRDLEQKDSTLQVGIYPSYGQLTVCLASESASILDEADEKLQKRFGKNQFPSECKTIEEALHYWFIKHHKTLAFAESCTGGLLGAKITALSGASSYFIGSLVTYSNLCKENILHVSHETLKNKGAVSKEVAEEMLKGLFKTTGADYGVVVTGIAGPLGATVQTPVGTIWYAMGKREGRVEISMFLAKGKNRETILDYSVKKLFGRLYQLLTLRTI